MDSLMCGIYHCSPSPRTESNSACVKNKTTMSSLALLLMLRLKGILKNRTSILSLRRPSYKNDQPITRLIIYALKNRMT
jgi:hypothetical protein